MLSVIVLGSGNVAQHLIKTFEAAVNVRLVQVYARHPEKLAHVLPENKITADINKLGEADIYIISVSDNAIANVSAKLPFTNRLVVHTSGSTGLDVPDGKNRRGVFYPLQTFSAAKEIDFNAIPLCLEAEFGEDNAILAELAHTLSTAVYDIDTRQRQALHVAAVFVSNFVNHMYVLGSEICSDNNIPFEILNPLIKEVADKVSYLPPLQAQTGPAVRNDTATLHRHTQFLGDSMLKEIYTLLTQSIQYTNEQKL